MTSKNSGHAGCPDYDGHAIPLITLILRSFAPLRLRLLLLKRTNASLLLQPLSFMQGSALLGGVHLQAWFFVHCLTKRCAEMSLRYESVVHEYKHEPVRRSSRRSWTLVLGLLFLGRGPDPQVCVRDKVICGYAGHHGIEKKVG